MLTAVTLRHFSCYLVIPPAVLTAVTLRGFWLRLLLPCYHPLQVLTAVTLRDFWLDDVLPFSCCPMFMLPRNIYDEWPKW